MSWIVVPSVRRDEPEWWRSGVVYQVYPRSFFDRDGDGVGDLDGVTARMNYLADTLRVDTIWLSPFYPSPLEDFGYDISDHTDVADEMGGLPAFDRLVAEAHGKGVRIIVDYIPNHTAADHPWFQESRSSRDNDKSDWYIWRDAKPDGTPPNNWICEAGGSAWEWEPARRQYYLHSFQITMPDLNWRCAAVRSAMFDVLRFWLDRGVDGFRIDVANLIMKDPSFRDNPSAPDATPNPTDRQHQDYTTQLHVYDRNHPDLHEVYRDIRRLLDKVGTETKRSRVAVGELEVMPRMVWVRYYGSELDELHIPFNFELIEVPWTASAIRSSVDELEAALPTGAWPNYVLGNHDRPRVAHRYGTGQARVAAMLLLTLRGTPTLYYGDELGLTEPELDPAQWLDPLGRDGTRAPMPWSDEPNAGFCRPEVTPWLSLPPNWQQNNIATQLADKRSILNLYRALLALRNATPAVHSGDYEPIDAGNENCFCYVRHWPGQRVFAALNHTEAKQIVRVPSPFRAGRLMLSTYLDSEPASVGATLLLRPDEGVLVEGK